MSTFQERLMAAHFPISEVPNKYKCPIDGGIMETPTTLSDGVTYSLETAKELLNQPVRQRNSPSTDERLERGRMTENAELKKGLEQFVRKVERGDISKKAVHALRATADKAIQDKKDTGDIIDSLGAQFEFIRKISDLQELKITVRDTKIAELRERVNKLNEELTSLKGSQARPELVDTPEPSLNNDTFTWGYFSGLATFFGFSGGHKVNSQPTSSTVSSSAPSPTTTKRVTFAA